MDWIYLADLAGVAVFAIAGTLLAFRKQMDGFGVIVLASATAIAAETNARFNSRRGPFFG